MCVAIREPVLIPFRQFIEDRLTAKILRGARRSDPDTTFANLHRVNQANGAG